MTTLALNKSELKNQSDRLKTYEKFLPSLELKRKQLMAVINKAKRERERLRGQIEEVNERLKKHYPMVAKSKVYINDLVRVDGVRTGTENVVGVRLPTFEGIEASIKDYGDLNTPFWLDSLAENMKKSCALLCEIKVWDIRIELLDEALRKTAQRLNLFEKVLIPQTKADIKKIRIYLSDAERASVVQAKIAKKKVLEQSVGAEAQA